MLRSAPVVVMPVPFKVSASVPVVMPPWICSAAPEVTLVPAAVVPSAFAFRMFNAPVLTVVNPV